MEKRFVTFIVLSMLILVVFQIIDSRVNPRPDLPDEQLAEQIEPAANPDVQDAEPVDEPADASQVAEAEVDRAEFDGSEAESAIADAPETAAGESAFEAQPTRVALGSLDPSSPQRLLIWLTSKGAAIECVALNSERYNDLERHYGYLGFLSLTEVAEGCRIGVVGTGTPAATAQPQSGDGSVGLAAGDIISAVDGEPLLTLSDYRRWIESTRPGQEVAVSVLRDGVQQQFAATLRNYPLEVIRPETEQSDTVTSDHPLSYRLGLTQLGSKSLKLIDEDELAGLPSLKTRHWQLIQDDANSNVAEFHYVLSAEELKAFDTTGPLRVIKRYRLAEPAEGDESSAYHLHYEVEFRNEATSGEPMRLAYQQDGPTGLPLEGWWYTYKTHPTKMGGAGVRDVVTKAFDGKYKMFTNPVLVEVLEENPTNPKKSMYEGEPPRIEFAGVDAQYFLSAMVADSTRSPDDYIFEEAWAVPIGPKDPDKQSRTDVTFRLVSRPKSIEPGGSYKQSFLIFAGPKKPDVLAQYGLGECITYGWFPLVAKPLIWILHAFHAVFRNYGIAIIMLTVLVRSLMLPIGRQQAMNAQKMQELAPEMRQIADKYKKDMEKRAAAQRELFQKHNYNPLAGCLPMLLQLPIFIGLYRALSVDIELRQAPLIPGLRWCSNLAGPDQLFNWESFVPAFLSARTGFLGPYLNILPLITVALMMVHQKLFTPPPTDEQQEMQHKMMKYMMLFFGFMFFRVPAGLCLYFITSNLWSVGERKLLPKPRAKTTTPVATSDRQPVKAGANGSGGGGNKNQRRSKNKRR